MAVTAQAFNDAASMQELYDLLARCEHRERLEQARALALRAAEEGIPARRTSRGRIGRAALDAAGRFVNTELAERRNLILANPVAGNKYPTVKTLVAAYQMVKAGEVARSHRHTANALRLVLDTGERAYTIVEGKKIPMEPGDVLLTPNWYWHGHSNEGPANAYWMDFLDVPTVHMLGPMFFEHHPDDVERGRRSGGAIALPLRVGATRRAPAGRAGGCRPAAAKSSSARLRWRTIALHVTRLDAGASFSVEPSTLNCIYAPMKGAAKCDDRRQRLRLGARRRARRAVLVRRTRGSRARRATCCASATSPCWSASTGCAPCPRAETRKANMTRQIIKTPVLIVGGGPVGLALAGDLGWRGVQCMLIERGDGRVENPKMDMVHIRTMEFCRRWGIVPWVESRRIQS